jgi:hypothetical protein
VKFATSVQDSAPPGYLVTVRLEFRAKQRVRCLVCWEEYSKPRGPGTLEANPGCPVCHYLGWEPLSRFAPREQHHFAADPRLLRSA